MERIRTYLGASIVQHSKGWLVALNGVDVDDGAALGHVGHCCLRHTEVGQDVAVEGELQPFPRDVLKLLHILALEACVVDKNIQPAKLVHCLLDNLPAEQKNNRLNMDAGCLASSLLLQSVKSVNAGWLASYLLLQTK